MDKTRPTSITISIYSKIFSFVPFPVIPSHEGNVTHQYVRCALHKYLIDSFVKNLSVFFVVVKWMF